MLRANSIKTRGALVPLRSPIVLLSADGLDGLGKLAQSPSATEWNAPDLIPVDELR
jgi:hypothetical protein